MANEKKSIVKEALTDYKEIMEAADANAKKKLAEQFPEKFNSLLKEELLNKNKKSGKESYKKIDESQESTALDESESNKESVMKTQTKETKKVVKETAGEGKPFDEKAKEVKKVEGDVKIVDTVGDGDPFKEKAKKAQKVDETAGDGKSFSDEKTKKLQIEEFDITELDVDSVGSALENADEDDEVVTMEAIEKEISEMENLEERITDIAEPSSPSYMDKGNRGIVFNELVNMRNKLDKMIKTMGGNVDEMHAAGATDGADTFGDTSQVEEMHQGDFPLDKMHNGAYDNKLIDEEGAITDDDIEAVLGAHEVDEASGMAHSSSKHVAGDHLPGKEFAPQRHKRYGSVNNPQNEGVDKKFNALLEENKKLTKKLNEVKKSKDSVLQLVEGYKTALEKYRNQLKEMAIFNTNLAHVNNLLVNEELALTQEDKIKIINEFKKVDSIADSQNKYKAFLTEMKESKKTLTESIKDKVAASVAPSSKQKLDEVIEKTAYENDEHIKKMRKLIEYVENRGKKNNL